jgi:hypothetical protein
VPGAEGPVGALIEGLTHGRNLGVAGAGRHHAFLSGYN